MPETIKRQTHCETKTVKARAGKPVTNANCKMDLPLPFELPSNFSFDKPWVVSGVCTPAFIFSEKAK